MTSHLLGQWRDSGRLRAPLPGSGCTTQRWRHLARLAEQDLVAARLAEAHMDAVAILAELQGPTPSDDQLWGVWAAEAPGAAVVATASVGDDVVLDGVKKWCSGAGLCSHALVTAALDDAANTRRGLFAVAVDGVGVSAGPDSWHNSGMAASDTRAVHFAGAPAVAVGAPGEYLERPGFWHGAIGVAACWLGGARAVTAPLYRRADHAPADPHLLAHLGAVDAALAAGDAMLHAAGVHIDRDPRNTTGSAELIARRVRAVAERAADEAITRTGRALGPAPLCHDAAHAQRVADLSVYIRQSHAEKDLAQLGRLAGADVVRRATRSPEIGQSPG